MKLSGHIILLFLCTSGILDLYGAEELPPAEASSLAPLLESAKGGDLRQFLRRIHAGDDPNQTDDQGQTPLMFAVHQPAFITAPMIRKLWDSGASLDTKDTEGRSALAHAILANKPQAFRQLLSYGAKVDLPKSLEIPVKFQKILKKESARREKAITSIIDPITHEDITSLDPSELITIGKNTYKKETMLNYILTQIASKSLENIKDPTSQVPIGREKIASLATHFNIPMSELENHTPLESLQTLEAYTAEHYILDEDASDDEDDTPASSSAPLFVEPRKRVFEGVRPTVKHPVEGFLEHLARQDSLRDFRNMIQNDTLRALSYRLQKKNSELLDEHLSDSDSKHIQSEIEILERAIKARLSTFKRQKAPREAPPEEPFFKIHFSEEE